MRKRWVLVLGFALVLVFIFAAAYLSAQIRCKDNVDCLGEFVCINGGYFTLCKLHCNDGTVYACRWRE